MNGVGFNLFFICIYFTELLPHWIWLLGMLPEESKTFYASIMNGYCHYLNKPRYKFCLFMAYKVFLQASSGNILLQNVYVKNR